KSWFSPFLAGEQLTSIGISSSTARLLHSGIHHVNLANFVFRPNYAPLPTSAAFSCWLAAYNVAPPSGRHHFHFRGWPKTRGHPISFGIPRVVGDGNRRRRAGWLGTRADWGVTST